MTFAFVKVPEGDSIQQYLTKANVSVEVLKLKYGYDWM